MEGGGTNCSPHFQCRRQTSEESALVLPLNVDDESWKQQPLARGFHRMAHCFLPWEPQVMATISCKELAAPVLAWQQLGEGEAVEVATADW